MHLPVYVKAQMLNLENSPRKFTEKHTHKYIKMRFSQKVSPECMNFMERFQ